MTRIHPSAIIDPKAEIGEDVDIGPYCVIGPKVRLRDRVRLRSHVVVSGPSDIGEDCDIFAFNSIGEQPQDLKYADEPSTLTIGPRCQIREQCTIHRGTAQGKMATVIGADCLLMAAVHVAHDCEIGDHVILANNATLGGHVQIGDHAFFGGISAVHQFVRIGHQAMIGGMTGIEADVIPYGLASGARARLIGLNMVGMKRRAIPHEEIRHVLNAYKRLFEGEAAFADRLHEVAVVYADQPRVMEIIDFINADSRRNMLQPRVGRAVVD